MSADAAAATWTSTPEGFRQEIGFTESGMFTVTTFPVDRAPSGRVLVCPSLNDELQRMYRREALLARKLARCGIVVQRFHSRGTGNSMGDDDELTASDLVQDARDALKPLITSPPGLPLGFMGARLGALVAATVAPAYAGAPLACWDPVPDLTTYARELRRAAAAIALTRRHQSSPVARNEPLPPRLVATAGELTLDTLADADGAVGPVFVGELGTSGPRDSRVEAIRALRAVAASVDVVTFPEEEGCWQSVEGPTRVDSSDPWPLLDRTAEWLVNALANHDR